MSRFGLEMRKLARGGDGTRRSRRRCGSSGSSHLGAPPAARIIGRPAAARGAGPGAGHQSRLLLLDEPLSNLDAKLREEVRVEIRELQQRLGLTTLLVTHDQEEALTMADRLVVMEGGRVRQIGSPAGTL